MISDACYNAHKLSGEIRASTIEKLWPTVLQNLHGSHFDWSKEEYEIMIIGANMREQLDAVD